MVHAQRLLTNLERIIQQCGSLFVFSLVSASRRVTVKPTTMNTNSGISNSRVGTLWAKAKAESDAQT